MAATRRTNEVESTVAAAASATNLKSGRDSSDGFKDCAQAALAARGELTELRNAIEAAREEASDCVLWLLRGRATGETDVILGCLNRYCSFACWEAKGGSYQPRRACVQRSSPYFRLQSSSFT